MFIAKLEIYQSCTKPCRVRTWIFAPKFKVKSYKSLSKRKKPNHTKLEVRSLDKITTKTIQVNFQQYF
jgi:hypothetical protein